MDFGRLPAQQPRKEPQQTKEATAGAIASVELGASA